MTAARSAQQQQRNSASLVDRINALEKALGPKRLRRQTTWAEVAVLWGVYIVTVSIPPAINTTNFIRFQWYSIMNSKAADFLGLVSSVGDRPNKSADGSKIAAAALAWEGRDFKSGVTAQCMVFVRQILSGLGLDPGVTARPIDGITEPMNPAMANSIGKDQGQFIKSKRQLKPGDIVFFGGTYGGYTKDDITHVGIYVGHDQIVDRPTAIASVKRRSIDTFKHFKGAIRLQAQPTDDFPMERYVAAIAQQESGHRYTTVNPHSGALGKYQFMPETLADYAGNCLGQVPSQDAFLNSPEMQDKLMGCYVVSLLPTVQKKSTSLNTQCRMLASNHYSGDANQWNDTKAQYYNGARYPSIAEYTSEVCQGF
ncbi:MAG: hypothetical protein F6K19_33435 [Cyanothece sp. SIO1E1]|nr:hypothetical protein [Cyanothece sp. SIO1E1]